MEKGEIIAKLKFWFGKEQPDIFNSKYHVEQRDNFVYVYKKKLKKVI